MREHLYSYRGVYAISVLTLIFACILFVLIAPPIYERNKIKKMLGTSLPDSATNLQYDYHSYLRGGMAGEVFYASFEITPDELEKFLGFLCLGSIETLPDDLFAWRTDFTNQLDVPSWWWSYDNGNSVLTGSCTQPRWRQCSDDNPNLCELPPSDLEIFLNVDNADRYKIYLHGASAP